MQTTLKYLRRKNVSCPPYSAIMHARHREARYELAHQQIVGLLDNLADPVAAMACVAAVLFEQLPVASWVGFYRVVETDLLRIGPYQGPVGCIEIPFQQGVCGAAAREQQTQIVPDVRAFPGHIACDAHSRSEVVVPILDAEDRLVAVLDLDSHEPAAFDETDATHLERIAELLRPCFVSS